MDGFTYYNIFDTKGIEYLFIIAFLILLVPFWIIINKDQQVTKRIQHTIGVLTANILRIPRGLFYNKNNNASYLNLTLLPVVSFLLFREDKGYWRWLAYAAFLLLFFLSRYE